MTITPMTRKQMYQLANAQGLGIATYSQEGITRYVFFKRNADDEFFVQVYIAHGLTAAKEYAERWA